MVFHAEPTTSGTRAHEHLFRIADHTRLNVVQKGKALFEVCWVFHYPPTLPPLIALESE
jgi:hypothetical protein